ncbi:SIMPL domain-containing protein [Sutcliffiella halmapala]|uniref:SIMPL domain-containing protein n=1 Tax=Sutcliffiella halmapala TaxID=79882 RepID=UPI000995750F|nr:SIMPL domain-containing protein [Sutcliffiella halmapala]
MVIQNRKMLVQGTAKKDVQPDIAYIQLGVVTSSPNVQEAQEENRVKANQLVQALLQMGIPQNDVETASYTSFPRYTDQAGSPVLTSYEVRHIFRITIRDITEVGSVIDAAFENGANITESLSFEVSTYDKIYRHVLQLAVLNGYQKACAIAGTLQVHLHPVPIKVEEVTQQTFFGPRYTTFAMQEKASTPIEPKEITITATVNLEYMY